MNSQRSSCLGCFSGSELAQSGPIWSVGRWVNRTHPYPLSLLPLSPKEKHAALCSPLSKIQLLCNKVCKNIQVPARHAQIPLAFSLWGRRAFLNDCVCCGILFCLWVKHLISLTWTYDFFWQLLLHLLTHVHKHTWAGIRFVFYTQASALQFYEWVGCERLAEAAHWVRGSKPSFMTLTWVIPLPKHL